MKIFIEITKFLKTAKLDYLSNSSVVTKKDKANCYWKIVYMLLWSIWNAITALLMYAIWYVFKKTISDKIYVGTSWEEIYELIVSSNTKSVERELKANGKFLFWLWTYGDCIDPYGWGGMPTDFRNGKNNFYNRWIWGAWRNPRFNINYLYYRTGVIVDEIIIIDTRNENYRHSSYGIGSSADGILFKWMKDDNNKWYFIYEDNNDNHMFYVGYVGLLKHGSIGKYGRFETSYRVPDKNYYVI